MIEKNELLLHRPRIFSPKLAEITSLAIHHASKTTAIGRANGVIEFYSYQFNSNKPQFLGNLQLDVKSEVFCLQFLTPKRLISCGPAGQINLIGLDNFNILCQENISSSVYAVAGVPYDPEVEPLNRDIFALACTDTIQLYWRGFVRVIFGVSEPANTSKDDPKTIFPFL